MIHPDRDLLTEAAIDLGRTQAVAQLLKALRTYEPSEQLMREVTAGELQTLDEAKRIAVANALHATGGNKMRAARILGCNVKSLYAMLKKWGWHEPGQKRDEAQEFLRKIPANLEVKSCGENLDESGGGSNSENPN